MNTANRLTLIRVLLIPVFIFFLMQEQSLTASVISLVIFITASITDYADGYIARKYNQITTFGKFVDPLADKLLIASALIVFVGQGRMHPVAAFIIIAREFLVTSLRVVAMGEGKVIAASASGKFKMVCQVAMAIVLLSDPLLSMEFGFLTLGEATLNDVIVWLTVAVTVWSGVDYLKANWAIVSTGLRSGKTPRKDKSKELQED